MRCLVEPDGLLVRVDPEADSHLDDQEDQKRGDRAVRQRCQDCDETDPSVTQDPQWGKRKEYVWGDYSRIYDNNRLRFLLNFTGYF